VKHLVVAVLLCRPGEVLLCHRSPSRRWYPDVWDFPGGHVEPGEDSRAALAREVTEELGVTLEGVDGEPVLHRTSPATGLDLTVWASRRWSGEIANRAPDEHDAIGWFGARQLEDLTFADPSHLAVVQHVLRS
jgi:8-oxo-dGTP diphosphatase